MENKKHHHRSGRKRPVQAYIPQGDPAALATPVEELGLFERTVNFLKTGGISTASDLAARYMRDMYKVQGVGKRDIFAMQTALKKLGLSFRPEEVSEQKPSETADKKQDKGAGERKAKPEQKAPVRDNNRDNNRENVRTRESAPQPRRGKQENGGRGGKKGAEALNKELSRIYAGLTINEIIMGGKKKRPAFAPYPKEGIKQGDLIKFYRGGKWGYKDWKGNVVIHPEYDEAFAFREDRAGVEENGLIGYIDKSNNKVIECKYDCGTSFSEGLAAVSIGEKSGYIDENGNEVTKMEFDVATPFADGKAIVRENDRWGVLDRETLQVLWR